nr:MAG TPA: hypothetical protein [Caudoviricetes sp.]
MYSHYVRIHMLHDKPNELLRNNRQADCIFLSQTKTSLTWQYRYAIMMVQQVRNKLFIRQEEHHGNRL